MAQPLTVRRAAAADFDAWRPLWDGYNAFYGREGPTALPLEVTLATWQRMLDEAEPVWCLVAESGGSLLGLAHAVIHRSTTRIEPVCYLSDLFTAPQARGQGIGRALIDGLCDAARQHGLRRVYWQTHSSNATGRRLYDQVAAHQGFIVYARAL